MTNIHWIRGQVPGDSPLQTLAGRTVTVPARSLPELASRVAEMHAVGIDPVIVPARYVPWAPIVVGLVGAVLTALIAALIAFATGHLVVGGIAAGAMVLLGLALFPVLGHLELESTQ